MDNRQFLDLYIKTKLLINNNKNIIICGPDCSGKTHLLNEQIDLLKQNNYNIYNSIDEFIYSNRINGITRCSNNFWIEETNEYKLVNVLDDYEFIRTKIISKNYIPFQNENIKLCKIE